MNCIHFLSVACIMTLFLLPQSAVAQKSDKPASSGGSSPYSIVRSVESIGNEILSLFSSDADQKSASSNAAPGRATGGRRTRKVFLWLIPGVHSPSDAAGQCQSGSGVCTFSISLGPNDGIPNSTSVSAQASYFPKQKRLVLQLDAPLDAQFVGSDGKATLSVHRGSADANDPNGTIVVKNKRLLVADGDYVVQNNSITLTIQ